MAISQLLDSDRKRAPSKRALATKARVLDAAEQVFAKNGFDGATIREIATVAGEPVGTIHHHGGGKENLFHKTVARRAATLAQARTCALGEQKSNGGLTLEAVLTAFFQPFFDLCNDDPRWRDYARIVAIVSSDNRWHEISTDCFDPTAQLFMNELMQLLPDAPQPRVAATFVFSISALIALLTSKDRIQALSVSHEVGDHDLQTLIRFCASGLSSCSD